MGSAKQDVELEDFGSIFSLAGKVAVVTGGSRGLGLNVASGSVHFCPTTSFPSSNQPSDSSKQAARRYISLPGKPKLAKKPSPP